MSNGLPSGQSDSHDQASGFVGLLRRIPKTVLLLDAAVAALSATLIRDRLIPENVEVIGPVAALFVIVCLAMTVVYQDRLHAFRGKLVALSLSSLMVLLIVQLFFVASVSPCGSNPGRIASSMGLRTPAKVRGG